MSQKISLVDLLIGGVCFVILGSLLLQGTARRRAAARSEACAANLIRIGLAMHNYHSAYKQLPMGSGGTHDTGDQSTGNGYRLGPLVGLTPFCEEQRLWEEITNTYISKKTNKPFPAMGPVPLHDPTEYEPWGKRPACFICPDDPEASKPSPQHSYVSCYGDATFEAGAPSGLIIPHGSNQLLRDIVPGYVDPYTPEGSIIVRATRRGAFMRTKETKFRDCLDGLANTVYMSETKIGLRIADAVEGMDKDPSKAIDAAQADSPKWATVTRGQCWADGSLAIGGFQTILPPNSPSALSPKGELDGIISASSHHADGVHVLIGDGRVKFVSNEIDAGEPTVPGINLGEGYGIPGSESPYGIWGALGTRASKETIPATKAIVEVTAEVKPPSNRMPTPRPNPPSATNKKTHEFRTWTDNSGKKRIKARFVRIIDRQRVEMEMEDGERVEVPINGLSNADAYYAVVISLLELSPAEHRRLQEDFFPRRSAPNNTSAPTPRLHISYAGDWCSLKYKRGELIAGIDHARILVGAWSDEEIALVVWTDFQCGGGGGGGSLPNGRMQGRLHNITPKKRITYEYAINQKKNSASLTINGQVYQLSNGAFFLVSTTTDKTVIRQLKRDLSKLKREPGAHPVAAYKRMAETDTELQNFFKSPKVEN
jgi:hypothetical protein